MKQVRFIRISFFICAALVICAFWTGYYFGNTQTAAQSLLTENTEDLYMDREENDSKENLPDEEENAADAVESMNAVSSEIYYLKSNGDYLAVYKGTSSDIYFETDLKPGDLPEAMQDSLDDGLEFDSLEELYSFLENYSS